MSLEFLGIRKKSKRLYLDFNFYCEEEKFFLQIGYRKNENCYSYNCKIFGTYILYYRRYLKKQGKAYNPKLKLEDFKAYASFLKEYIKGVHLHNFWFSNALQTRQNLEKEINFIEALILFLKENEKSIRKGIK